MRMRSRAWLVSASLVLVLGLASAASADPQPPQADPGPDRHIFYGTTPPWAPTGAALVFVHGLRGHAGDWWVDNDMYRLAHAAGYRTAFVNLSRNLSRNDAGVIENAAVLTDAIPKIARRFRVDQVYVIAHSKGAVDAQAAIIRPEVSFLVRAVFMISPPNHGSELADWAFGPGQSTARGLGLLTPGVFALQTDKMATFRPPADLAGAVSGIPYFTLAGGTFLGNPLTRVTGQILAGLTGGKGNDGFVTLSSTRLPVSYAADLGVLDGHHFRTNDGHLAFPRIHAQIKVLEARRPFQRIATRGFGDRQNSFAWSMKWFKGRLYVGTGRAFLCVTAATADAQTGSKLFRPVAEDLVCAPTPKDLPLAAEIWRYSPATGRWQRVYRSPENVPIEFDIFGQPTKHTARDIAYRGMATFVERDGTEALYVSGVSAGAIFADSPPYDTAPRSFPPPRILRSVDGVSWRAVPQAPGTFLGDIGLDRPGRVQVRGLRSMVSFRGRLFVTATDFRGVGVLLASENPSAGNGAWRQVSPSADRFPIWTLYPWNGWLYMTTGDRQSTNGYAVYKTRAVGPGPYRFEPVVTEGAFQIPAVRSPDALSLQEFGGKLYVGSDRPTELIRIDRDDSWQLVVGGPRVAPDGRLLRPLSGLLTGFGNVFNGHFWRMKTHGGRLFLGTWDWSVGFRSFPRLGPAFRHEQGTDFFTTRDGRYWSVITKQGFGDRFNYGVRSLESTPAGLFVGTANPWYGLQVFRATSAALGNLDRAGLGVSATLEAGVDAIAPETAPPERPWPLEAVSTDLLGGLVALTWDGSEDVAAYEVFRSRPRTVTDALPSDFSLEIPGTGDHLTVARIRAGAFERYCRSPRGLPECDLARAIAEETPIPGPWERIATVADRWFVDDVTLSPEVQALYYVVAIDAAGRASEPSNVAGGPSAAAAVTFAAADRALHRAVADGAIADARRGEDLGRALRRARAALLAGNVEASTDWLERLAREVETGDGAELGVLVRSLVRRVFLVGRDVLPAGALLG